MTMWTVFCDTCGLLFSYGEYVAWTDKNSASEIAQDSDWHIEGDYHYCPDHHPEDNDD